MEIGTIKHGFADKKVIYTGDKYTLLTAKIFTYFEYLNRNIVQNICSRDVFSRFQLFIETY